MNRELIAFAGMAGFAGLRLLWSRRRECRDCAQLETDEQIDRVSVLPSHGKSV
jgi:hypothetical protein